MPDFVWKAARADAQIVDGRLQASSLAQAMQQLRAQGLTPLHISESDVAGVVARVQAPAPTPARSTRLFSSNAITQADILVMTSELSIMLKAGLALDNALRVLIGMNAKPDMISLTQTVLDDVKGGVPLSRALVRHPQHFGDFYINMEQSTETFNDG